MGKERVLELFSLDGKTALVTDVGKGISQEVASALSDAGAKVVIANPDLSAGETLAARICAEGGSARFVQCDLVDEVAVVSLFDRVSALHGGLDIAVNCAALALNFPFPQTSLEQFDIQFGQNLRSPFLLMREAVRWMTRSGQGGRIVNMSTMGSIHPVLEGNAIYSSSRAALNMMSRNIALDHVGDRILVNVVLLGAITGKVAMHEDTLARIKSGHQVTGPALQPGRLPLGNGDASDVAAAVLFLVGPSGGYMTGQTLTIDGGFLLT
jgi:NAD(P)-dependent dehydrogenase (short-subunit alcohol dehydrogenase family)